MPFEEGSPFVSVLLSSVIFQESLIDSLYPEMTDLIPLFFVFGRMIDDSLGLFFIYLFYSILVGPDYLHTFLSSTCQIKCVCLASTPS